MTKRQFDFENHFQDLLNRIEDLKSQASGMDFNLNDEFSDLEEKIGSIRENKYQTLSPWERLLLSRNADRPGSEEYIAYLCDSWIELQGDRLYGDDRAVIGGIGIFQGQPVTVLGHRKGKNTKENLQRNFGMPHPEGYRKVERLLRQAEKFGRPVITLVDTPGAYPGIGAEERGQALAISQVLMLLSGIRVPVVTVLTGEGGSGGALALAVSDYLIMLSNSVFSISSPEACASILWKNLDRTEEMASALKITARDLLELGIADEIIEEPVGGANQDFETTALRIRDSVGRVLSDLIRHSPEDLVAERYRRLRKLGQRWLQE